MNLKYINELFMKIGALKFALGVIHLVRTQNFPKN